MERSEDYMLNVPAQYTEGYVLLYSTPTGAAILESPNLATAVGLLAPSLTAYGMAVNPTTVHLTTRQQLQPPHQACILAHELTHCLDLAFWKVGPDQRTSEMTGATEINAHYNQGLVAKELSMIPGLHFSLAEAVRLMTVAGSRSTFGQMANTWTRNDVIEYLLGTDMYKGGIDKLRTSKPLYLLTKDDQWETGTKMFHCEAHLALNNPGNPYW
jgi:hypothetical protein